MRELEDLPNIGKIMAQKLRSIGIASVADLKKTGAVAAFKKIQLQTV